jgi:hypothetical protein
MTVLRKGPAGWDARTVPTGTLASGAHTVFDDGTPSLLVSRWHLSAQGRHNLHFGLDVGVCQQKYQCRTQVFLARGESQFNLALHSPSPFATA